MNANGKKLESGQGTDNAVRGLATLQNLFPTKISFVIFVAYMALFINQVLLKYFIPSFLYCLYNNLTFINLSSYDPTTYFLLLQFRVVVTGVIFQILFNKRLTRHQWLSLILLTCGCIIKQINYSTSSKVADKTTSSEFQFAHYFNANLLLILIQILCSCFAGVYNEYILKEKDNQVDIMLQNVFMYIDSIICGFLFLGIYSSPGAQSSTQWWSLDALKQLWDLKVVLIMINNASVGIVTSLFLKSLNSILKSFASALELMFTAVLAWLIFGIALDKSTCIAILVVSFATWLYSINPVNNNTNNGGNINNGSVPLLNSLTQPNVAKNTTNVV